MVKILGYVFALLGLISIALYFPAIRDRVTAIIPFLANISNISTKIFIIIGVVLIVLGAIFLRSKGGVYTRGRTSREVPIYEGDRIVGYRRR